MTISVLACLFLVLISTVLHYEVLRGLHGGLPTLRVPRRAKLLVVMFTTFLTHAAQMALYGGAFYSLVRWLGAGTLDGSAGFSLSTCMYFSAETYTSLGFGDLTPVGPVRLLAGVEALNGLLLIGWSASFLYIAMQRFWPQGTSPSTPSNNECTPP